MKQFAKVRAEERRAELVDAALGRLYVEAALDLSDEELKRCFKHCACPDLLIKLMQEEREMGRTIPPNMMSEDAVNAFISAGKPLPDWVLNRPSLSSNSGHV